MNLIKILVFALSITLVLSNLKGETMEKVYFESHGDKLVGHLFFPDQYEKNKKYPVVVVTGAWTTVKEQMAGTYAKALSKKGYITLAFDFRGWGESKSAIRYLEDPKRKIEDIISAVSYIASRNEVDKHKISGLGICASSGYMLSAAQKNNDLKSVALVAPWLHNKEIVEQVYGGKDGVENLIKLSIEAHQSNESMILEAASMTNDKALMYRAPYYTEKDRGLIAEYDNKFNVASWQGWLKFDAIQIAEKLNKPILLIHSEAAALPNGAKLFSKIMGKKAIEIWLDNVTQFDFYDKQDIIKQSIDSIDEHLLTINNQNK